MFNPSIVRRLIVCMWLMLIATIYGVGSLFLTNLNSYLCQQKVVALASVDLQIFDNIIKLRAPSGQVQTALLTQNDAAATIKSTYRDQDATEAQTVAVLTRLGWANVGANPKVIAALWSKMVANRAMVNAQADKPKEERRLKPIGPWIAALYGTIGYWIDQINKIDDLIRLKDPTLANFVTARQVGWTIRDKFGSQCSILRPFVRTSTRLPTAIAAKWNQSVGGYTLVWQGLDQILAYKGADAVLVKTVAAARSLVNEVQKKLDSLVVGFDDSNHPAMAAADFTTLCHRPFGKVVAISQIALSRAVAVATAKQAHARNDLIVAAITLMVALGVVILGMMVAIRRVGHPLAGLTATVGRLVARDWSVAIPATQRQDEFGTMARALEVFKTGGMEAERLAAEAEATRQTEIERQATEAKARIQQVADEQAAMEEKLRLSTVEAERARTVAQAIKDFETEVASVIDAVATAASRLGDNASALVNLSEEATRQSAGVGAAAEETSANVQTVASATEELTTSSKEVGRQAQTSEDISRQAVKAALDTNENVRQLETAATEIGAVARLIEDIASQTNLLALNATIEAARAGDAGKGFAVVASEVKTLANQTATATEQITSRIAGIQTSTHQTVIAIEGIGTTIGRMSEAAAAIAAAVEEQIAATAEIARGVEEAARGTSQVTAGIHSVGAAAGEANSASVQVSGAAIDLGQQSDHLRQAVDRFLHVVSARR